MRRLEKKYLNYSFLSPPRIKESVSPFEARRSSVLTNVTQRSATHLILVCLALLAIGMVMIYSATAEMARLQSDDSSLFLRNHAIRVVIGLLLMFLCSRVDTKIWAQFSRAIMLCAIGLLILVLVIGNGSVTRWLPLPFGLNFQPSEMARVALVLYLADVLVRKENDLLEFRRGLLPRLIVVGLVLILIGAQPDLGTAIAIGCIAIAMLCIGGVHPLQLLCVLAVGGVGVFLSLHQTPYQMSRLTSFLDLYGHQGGLLEGNYQLNQSLIGMGNGGLIGVGLGNSIQKSQYLPELHTDFVFAIVGEELGLIGTLAVCSLFIWFSFLGLRIANSAPTHHGFLLASGLTAMVSIYAVINIGVVIGILPTTGLPLPFLSYGGSSLILNLVGVGILLGVARQSLSDKRLRPR